MKIGGIYLIINKINGKMYVGSAVDIRKRWNIHKHKLRNNKHINKYLQSAWDKYGEENFEFVKFEVGIPAEELINWEQAVLDFYESYNREKGYNVIRFAGSQLGYKHTDESRVKIKEIRKYQKCSLETRIRMSKSQKIIQNTPEMFIKHSEAMTGEKNLSAILKDFQVKEIKILLEEGRLVQREIAEIYQVDQTTVSLIKTGKIWKHIII